MVFWWNETSSPSSTNSKIESSAKTTLPLVPFLQTETKITCSLCARDRFYNPLSIFIFFLLNLKHEQYSPLKNTPKKKKNFTNYAVRSVRKNKIPEPLL